MKSLPPCSQGAWKVSPSPRRTSEFSRRRTLISSLESDSKRSTLESSSTSSSSRIVLRSSPICANPLCFLLKLFGQAYPRESFVARREWVWVAIPGLEGGQVAVLRLYARSGCSILLYRGWAHHPNELFITRLFRSGL